MKKKTNKPDSLDNLLDRDFHYYLEYDYRTDSHCEENGCNEEGICHCSTIEDFELKSVDIHAIAKEFFNLAQDEFTQYCIHRALIACKIWDIANWEETISHGYYGEEIDWIKLILEAQQELRSILSKILSYKSNKEKLFITLEKEYGYILPELKEINDFEIMMVNAEDIHAGNQDHYKKLDKAVIEQYKDYTLPIGVGIQKHKYIKLIDGYHRFAANKNKNVSIIVGK